MSEEVKTPELVMLEKVAGQIENYAKELGDRLKKDDLKPLNEAIEALKNGTADKTAVDEVKKGLEKLSTLFEEMREDVAAGRNKHGSIIKSPGQAFIDHLVAQKFNWETWSRNPSAQHILLDHAAKVREKGTVNKGTFATGSVDAVGTNSIPWELADFETGLARIARRQPFLLQIANTSPISTMYAQWAEQENPEGDAGWVTEGSTKPQIDFDWVEKSAKVEKVADWIKVTKEALADLPGLRNEIDTELQELVMLKADDGLWDGTGVSPMIKGITEFATTYSTPSGITAENNYDHLRAAIAQVVNNHFIPNYIVMNPSDAAGLDTLKDSEGRYLIPPFKSADGQSIARVPVVESLVVDQGTFLVGDFTKWRVRIREAFNIDMGFVDDDFTRNLVTILGEMRLVSYVKANHVGAFVLGEFGAS